MDDRYSVPSTPPPDLTLKDGRTLRFEVSYADGLAVELSNGESARLPYPSSGFNDCKLTLSPSERYLLVCLFSGQSEIGYELFEMAPLRHVLGFPYVHGEGDGCAVRARRQLVRDRVRGEHWAAGLGRESVFAEATVLEWGTIHRRWISSGAVATCRVHVRVPAGYPGQADDYYWPDGLTIATDGLLLETGWGAKVPLAFPLEDAVVDGPPVPGAS